MTQLTVTTHPTNTMSSREIAKLTDKSVSHIHRDIAVMLTEIDHPNLDHLIERDARGYIHQYHLPRRECEILVTGYDVRRRAAVIDRWMALEQQALAAQSVALPSAKELALLVIQAEEDKEQAQAEVERLNQVCNTVTRQFIPGETAARFCMQLNGVNCQKVQGWLVSRGHLISEGSRGYRPSCHTRDVYFKLYTGQQDGKEVYQAQLTQKGCRWLYNKYLKGELPMKKRWNGMYSHIMQEATVMTDQGLGRLARDLIREESKLLGPSLQEVH